MWDRLLLAMDEFDSGQAALAMAAGLAARSGAGVVVLHVRERSPCLRVPPLETTEEAQAVVDDAVAALTAEGVPSCGVLSSSGQHLVARQIVTESVVWSCDAIILGSTRRKGISRINAAGVRERVLRESPLPVLVAPASLQVRDRLRKCRVEQVRVSGRH